MEIKTFDNESPGTIIRIEAVGNGTCGTISFSDSASFTYIIAPLTGEVYGTYRNARGRSFNGAWCRTKSHIDAARRARTLAELTESTELRTRKYS